MNIYCDIHSDLSSPPVKIGKDSHCVFRNSPLRMAKYTVYEWLLKRLSGRGDQAALGKYLGLDSAKVSRTLNGDRKMLPKESVMIANYFGISINEVLTGKAPEPQTIDIEEAMRESELAVVYILKVILQIMMQHQMVSTKGLDFNFSEALSFYHNRKLTKAAEIMEKFRVFVSEEPRVLEQAINRILLEPEPQRPA